MAEVCALSGRVSPRRRGPVRPITREHQALHDFRSHQRTLGASPPRAVMRLPDPASAPPFTRAEGFPPPVARRISPVRVQPWLSVSGITPSLWLLWRLRRHAGLVKPARLGDPVFTQSERCGACRCPVRPWPSDAGWPAWLRARTPPSAPVVVAGGGLSPALMRHDAVAVFVMVIVTHRVWGSRNPAITLRALP